MTQILVGVIIGMIIGRFFRLPRQCPREIAGYSCKGKLCDHSDTLYYDAKLQEALFNDRFSGKGGGNA